MVRKLVMVMAMALSPVAALPQTPLTWHDATPAESALDAAAFGEADQLVRERMADVQSVVVVVRGRVAYEYYRDGSPDALRDVQSVAKSALSTLVGVAMAQGRITSLDQTVVSLVPEWASLNADPRAASITLAHLLRMTSGFAVNDPTGTGAAGTAAQAWSRPMGNPPGQAFAYDNAVIPLLSAVLEKCTGVPLAQYANENLVAPLGLNPPSYERGLRMRTRDMARLGQLWLQNGRWDDRQIAPAAYIEAATRAQNAGGPPVGLPYGHLWWVAPGNAARPTFLASGFGGQFIWVHPPLELVVAINSNVSRDSNQRGQALQLIRGPLFAAAQKRALGQP